MDRPRCRWECCVCVVLDEQKAGVDREAGELRASLREVEKARLAARRDVHDVRRHLKNVDAERCRLSDELAEMQVRAARRDQLADSAHRDNTQLRQQVTMHRQTQRFI